MALAGENLGIQLYLHTKFTDPRICEYDLFLGAVLYDKGIGSGATTLKIRGLAVL